MAKDYTITHLKQLESEAIFILRETAAQFEKPVLLFSGGKDSIVMAHLAKKAFYRLCRPDHDSPQNGLDALHRSDQKSGDQKMAGDLLSPNL